MSINLENCSHSFDKSSVKVKCDDCGEIVDAIKKLEHTANGYADGMFAAAIDLASAHDRIDKLEKALEEITAKYNIAKDLQWKDYSPEDK